MLLATIVLLGALPQSADLARAVAKVPTEVTADVTRDSSTKNLPTAPKVKADVEADGSSVTATVAGADAVQPPIVAQPIQPMKQAFSRPRETRAQRAAWYALTVAGSGAAAFDAYSTRQALARNYGTEGNPLLRPFAHSSAIYAATQVSPMVMDYIGKRMMVSQNRWMRRLWWLPQAAGSGFSVAAGVHNLGVVP
jgi:hypothetical protein